MIPKEIKQLIKSDREKAMSLAWEIIAECQIHEKPFDIPLQQAKLTARKMIGGLSKERLIAIIEDRNQKQFVHFGPIGDLRTSTIFFRSFAYDLLKRNGVVVYFFHNHPCGSKPSQEDIELKNILHEYLTQFEVTLYFFVVTSKTFVQY